MLRSMTGFGKGEAKVGDIHYEINCKSVNGRFLEVNLRLPSSLWEKEGEARKIFSSSLSRGKVDVFWKDLAAAAGSKILTADVELAKNYQAAFGRMAEALGLEANLRADTVARYPEVIGVDKQEVEDEEEAKKRWECLKEATVGAIAMLQGAREREGAALQAELDGLLNSCMERVAGIEKASAEAVAAFQEKIKKRLEKLLENIESDDPRLVTEAGILADKADIREELVRFRTHVEEFKRLMDEDKPQGKRLDFLSQELLREANTMGSKSPDAALSHQVVALKGDIEQIKEQILNVE